MTRAFLIGFAALAVACGSDTSDSPDVVDAMTDVAGDLNADVMSESDLHDRDTAESDVASDATQVDADADADAAQDPGPGPRVDEELVDRIVQAGECTNVSDVSVLESSVWRSRQSTCRTACGADWECYAACLVDRAELSAGCAMCQALDEQCRVTCRDECEANCGECWEEQCEPEYVLCAGALGPSLDRWPAIPPGAVCQQPDISATLLSTEFGDTANACASDCSDQTCLGLCLDSSGSLVPECVDCVVLWHECAQAACPDSGTFPFSAEQFDCAESSGCNENLRTCVGADDVGFPAYSTVDFGVRVSSAVPSIVSMVAVESGRPILRGLRANVVTAFFRQLLDSGEFPLGFTAGAVGPDAEVLAVVGGSFEVNREHTVHLFERDGAWATGLVVEPRFSRSQIRIFNGLTEPFSAEIVGHDVMVDIAPDEVSDAFEFPTPLDVVLDGSTLVSIPDLGGAAALVLWMSSDAEGLRARVTTSRGGFVSPTPTPIP